MLADPLRQADCPTYADGGVAMILAAEGKAEELCEKPAWITGMTTELTVITLVFVISLLFLLQRKLLRKLD